jgi:Uma2 family endonuclease
MPVDIRLTYDDFCLLPNDGKRYEIIDGELLVTPAPISLHQRVVTQLTMELAHFVKRHRLGEVFVSPFDVVFSRYDVVEPDILFISKARASVLTEKNVQGAPDLVIEVLSESTRDIDRTTKLKLYARYGVAEYWIIDPWKPSAEIYRRSQSGFERSSVIESDGLLTTPLMPGFSLKLAELVETRG